MYPRKFILSILICAPLILADFACTDCSCTNYPSGASFERVLPSTSESISKNKSVPLCIHFVSSSENFEKAAVAVNVDIYSAVTIAGAHNKSLPNSNIAGSEIRIVAQTDPNIKSVAIVIFKQFELTISHLLGGTALRI